jgi:hypothetical protein
VSDGPITCFLRYTLAPGKEAEFEAYAEKWRELITRHGGRHHGYFVPRAAPASVGFSFPGVGKTGPDNVAVALFSFPDEEAYEAYRRGVAEDPECAPAASLFTETGCFLDYERSFLSPR